MKNISPAIQEAQEFSPQTWSGFPNSWDPISKRREHQGQQTLSHMGHGPWLLTQYIATSTR